MTAALPPDDFKGLGMEQRVGPSFGSQAGLIIVTASNITGSLSRSWQWYVKIHKLFIHSRLVRMIS